MAKKTRQAGGRRRSSVASRLAELLKPPRLNRSGKRAGRRRGARTTGIRFKGISPDRKLDLIGVILIGVGLFSIVSMLSATQGLISRAWVDLLAGGFGWGMVVLPLGFLAGGLWLVVRTFGDRLPRLRPEQVIGALLLYLVLLSAMQAVLVPQDWAQSLELARQGRGGGLIGAVLLQALLGALGLWGTVIALVAVGLVGIVLTVGVSVPELFASVGRGISWLRRPFLGERQTVGQRRRAGVATPGSRPGPFRSTPPGKVGTSAVPLAAKPELASPLPSSHETQPSAQMAWVLPEMHEVLESGAVGKADDEFDRERATLIEETLLAFGAPAKVVEVNRGPTITQFGVEPDFVEGRGGRRIKVKVSKISALADDLALALAAPSIRVEAPVPSKGYVGIEVPNTEISLVALRDVMEAEAFQKLNSHLRIGLGQDVSGHAVSADLGAMPHLLIAGTTGSGKSVCVNAIIACLLLQNTPDDLRLVMVDPKRVELTYYNGIPHLLAPVVVELERVVPALQWVSREMDERYHRFAKDGTRNIDDFNQKAQQAGQKPLPYLVVVIDELADLMMLAPDETERVITRLAQLARATGIHLVIATQRPSVDVVTGLIKANFPARIAFAVASSVDSRVILDQPGAERLLGRGDMLFQSPDAPAPIRMQGAFVSERELNRLINHWRLMGVSTPPPAAQAAAPGPAIPPGVPLKQAPLWEEVETSEGDGDALFGEAVEIVRQMHRASISLLQRRLRIGYTRAARLIDDLEEKGIVGPAQQGSQAREVLDYGELPQAEGEE